MDYLKENKRRIVVMMFLVLGLAVGIYLVQTKQIFKSRAASDIINNSFQVQGATRTGLTSFETNTLDVTVTFTDPGILQP